MNPRETFLKGLFRRLDSCSLPYCVMRNYDHLFTAEDSDVDLVVKPGDLARFAEMLVAAGAEAGLRLVQRARYVDYSYVFWSSDAGFIRIDCETEVRWHIFPFLSATDILASAARRGEFFVPHPAHEAAVLLLQAFWNRKLPDRYRTQLARLWENCPDREFLRGEFTRAFGGIGHQLCQMLPTITAAELDHALCARIKKSIIAKTLTRVGGLRDLTVNLFTDIGRLRERLLHPPGLSLAYAAPAASDGEFDRFNDALEFLFPAGKRFVEDFDASRARSAPARASIRSRRRALFKGGLFVRKSRVGPETPLAPLLREQTKFLDPQRTFAFFENARREACFAHLGTGFMTNLPAPNPDGDSASLAVKVQFLANILADELAGPATAAGSRGRFVVLIGLDGSGKTTLARNLCQLAGTNGRFAGVRYHHLRPKFRERELPLPELLETPRKAPLPRTAKNAILSVARVLKSLVLARLVHHFRVIPLLRRNHLVLVDRYFYNYHLDPVSVKYAGPEGLLRRFCALFPKPDLVITLNASAEVLLSRKRELSPAQIREQVVILESLDFYGTRHLALDARLPADQVAQAAMAGIIGPNS